MKIILLQDVPNVGRKDEVKNVSDGYARNFLILRKLARLATPTAIKSIEGERKRLEQEKEVQKDILKMNLDNLKDLRVEIKEKTNEKGHLFAAIHAEEISKILKEQYHLEIPAEMIELKKTIKEIGEYKVKVKDKEFIMEVV